ncbi:MAG: extracellular solute-binding protein [Candidatus Uhrbacteria bacterium]
MKRLLSFLVLCGLVLTGLGCSQSQAEKEAAAPVTLKVWAVFEDQTAMEQVMDAYRRVHSNISFDLRLLRYDEYEAELWRAFATGEGPDVFALHNTWLGEYTDLITPLPTSLTIPYTETTGTIKKETVTVLRQEKSLTLQDLKNNFVDVVYDDVVRPFKSSPDKETEDRIFALPMSVDTMVLFSNTEILNAANIAEPPTTWQEFMNQVKTITRINEKGEIISSAAALGTGSNVERGVDILSVLMMQNNTVMERNNQASFAESNSDRKTPGLEAVRFYTDFANPVKDVYTWNADLPNSFEAFVNGETAFFFGYAYSLPLIKARAPKLDYRISPLPQIENGKIVNVANYWLWVVAKSSKQTKWGWDFLQFASKKENVENYLSSAKRPTALRGLINKQAEDPDLNIFASQLLTAESWYHGKDAGVVETAFSNLLDQVLLSDKTLEVLLKETQNKVNQTY